MNNYVDPYEQMLLDDFRHNIMEGRITTSTLKQMIEENKLSSNQLKVIEELAPFLGGVGNVAKSAYNGLKNMGSNIKNSFNQGKQQTVLKNSVGETLKALGALSNAVTQLQQATGDDYSSLLNYTQQWSAYAKSLINPQQAPQQQQTTQQTGGQATNPLSSGSNAAPNPAATQAQPARVGNPLSQGVQQQPQQPQRRKQPLSRKQRPPVRQ